MKVLVTGATGQLGAEVLEECRKRGFVTMGVGSCDLDMTDEAVIEKTVSGFLPDVIIHCAAMTDVEACERPENKEKAYAINSAGTQKLAECAKSVGAKLLYTSTEFVFGKENGGMDCDTPILPVTAGYPALNWYGETKRFGENFVMETLEKFFIVRISWLFGNKKDNFIEVMKNLVSTHASLRVVDDQIGRPTYTKDLARLLTDMVTTEKYGIYNVQNEGDFVSRAELTEEIVRIMGLPTEIVHVSTAEYGGTGTIRPTNSRLDTSKLLKEGFEPLPDWKASLAKYLGK